DGPPWHSLLSVCLPWLPWDWHPCFNLLSFKYSCARWLGWQWERYAEMLSYTSYP
ncbi:hypothetical protein M9458_046011, partial [Cirrhinus mrigala]